MKKDKQYNDQTKNDKGTNNDLQTLHRKRIDVKYEPHQKPDVNSSAPEG